MDQVPSAAVAYALCALLPWSIFLSMEGARQRIPPAWRTRAAGKPRRLGAVTRRTPVQVAGARYYSPGLGRWMCRDPLEEEGGLNLCGFLSNRAVDAVDALGESLISIGCARAIGNLQAAYSLWSLV
jgi:RHS repeat-associated protein